MWQLREAMSRMSTDELCDLVREIEAKREKTQKAARKPNNQGRID